MVLSYFPYIVTPNRRDWVGFSRRRGSYVQICSRAVGCSRKSFYRTKNTSKYPSLSLASYVFGWLGSYGNFWNPGSSDPGSFFLGPVYASWIIYVLYVSSGVTASSYPFCHLPLTLHPRYVNYFMCVCGSVNG
ncbi:hypothetical protein F4774DRAFT_395423 [Daldinia eschscholtzii]|nr:hypothetical protein F4774DRAFT_395423 [Daldinia eschscholtzii]